MYDTIIIGGGPGGYVAAIRSAQLGLKTVLLEKDYLGGTCLNRGCIPTKSLLHISSVFSNIKHAGLLGIGVSDPTINFSKMIARKDQLVKGLSGGIQWLMKKNGVDVIRGEADLLSNRQVSVQGNIFEGKNIIIAVGSSPVIPSIPGIHNSNVITSDDALHLKELPDSIAVIGGGVVGIELAVMFQSLGCKTVIIEKMERIAPMMDKDISKSLEDLLKSLGISIFTNTEVQSIDPDQIVCRHEGMMRQIRTSKVLVSVGRCSNGRSLSLDKVGIKHQNGVIETDEWLRTNIPDIYAIGDVNGKYMLAHTASAEAITAVENIKGIGRPMNYRTIPQCIYTFPEAAAVGLTEEEALQKGYQIKTSNIPLAANGKSLVEGYNKGFVKMISDQSGGHILGVHILAPHASEIITQCSIAMRLNAKASDLVYLIFPHPSVSELIHEAVHGVVDRPIHI